MSVDMHGHQDLEQQRRPDVSRIDTQNLYQVEEESWTATSPVSSEPESARKGRNYSPHEEHPISRTSSRKSWFSFDPNNRRRSSPPSRAPDYSKYKKDKLWSRQRVWRNLTWKNLKKSQPARWILIGALVLIIYWKLFSGPSTSKPALKPKLFPQDLYAGTARREAHLRLTNPETIPYDDLYNLPSSIDPDDPNLNITVLFLPLAQANLGDLEDAVRLFQLQDKQPTGFYLYPTLTPHAIAETELAVTGLPLPSDSQFTFVLPLLSPNIKLGYGLLRTLLRLAGTREFSGALLELGRAQAALVQTAWIDRLNLSLDEAPRNDQLTWRRRGLSAIRVSVVDLAHGKNGFWMEGLQYPSPKPPPHPAGNEPGVIKFFVEQGTRWEKGWQDLVCEFVHRQATWTAQVVFLFPRETDDLGCRLPPAQAARATGVGVKISSVQPIEWTRELLDADVALYLADGVVDRHLRHYKEASFTRIPLPEADLPCAVWIAALEVEALREWHTPQIELTVITNNRATSLDRLLSSLEVSHYFSDTVHLTISMEQTADFATQSLLTTFTWPYGPYQLRKRVILGGLMPAVVESWYPATNHSYGVFLEDDVEVSPLFYAWLKFTILKYRYTTSQQQQAQRLYGISLYQPKNVELRPEGRQPFDAHILFEELALPLDTPYLCQIPCSWGAAYFPEIWREYHEYLAIRLSEVSIEIGDIVVPDLRSNRWPRSWKKYFNELVYLRGYSMLYPNYPNFLSFSTNHLERGTHVKELLVDYKKKMQFEVPLMPDTTPALLLDLPGGALPQWSNLPVLDLWGSVVTEEEIIARGWAAAAGLATCSDTQDQPYDTAKPPTYNAKELLCPRDYDPSLNLTAWEEPMESQETLEPPVRLAQ